MVSENVLALDNGRYAFFHEGFFDYCFARYFARQQRELLDLLLEGEQGLFRRAQVRQALLFLREVEFHRYLTNTKGILSSNDVRFHVKQTVFALLAELPLPRKEEWEIVSPYTNTMTSDPMSRTAWTILYRPAWFQVVDSLGLVQEWLEDGDEEVVDRTVLLLRVNQRHFSDRVAELMEPFVDQSASWNTRVAYLAQWADWSRGRRFLELMLRLIDEGILDDVKGPIAVNSDFWNLLHALEYREPSWGCEAIRHYLDRRRRLSMDAGESNPFAYDSGVMRYSQTAEGVLIKCASDAPKSFVQEILPFMQAVIQDNVSTMNDGLQRDNVWPMRTFGSGYSVEDALLKAMETALSKLAQQEPEAFRSAIQPIVDSTFETIQFLILRGLASSGSALADQCVDHLSEEPKRLNIGYASDSHWAARQLVESISQHCSEYKLKQLEDLLLGYYSPFERSKFGKDRFGYAQFTLLSGIASARQSQRVQKRIDEWRRKFPEQEPTPPRLMEATQIQSPIREDAAQKMNDEQWLSAMTQYDSDALGFDRYGEPIGGALELSRVLEEQTKSNPTRFAALAQRLPDDTAALYFGAILRGCVIPT